ncbi:MAG TPA: glycosyltransferase [Rhodanobacteraceae bacterium]|nr:glycosyltransferase [Rhodanobacteraceae bacterium]
MDNRSPLRVAPPRRGRPQWSAPGGAHAPAPVVSVVTPTYNAAATIAETVASVAAQSWREFEMIVVDDGSTDATPKLLAQLARRHPWISWCIQDNAGVAAARNTAIAMARGELIAFLDADDVWEPNKLALQIAAFERNPDVVFVYADERDFWPDRERSRTLFQQKQPARGKVLRALFERGNFILTSTAVVRKSALQAMNGFDPGRRINEDVDLWFRMAEQYEFDYVPQVLVRRRILAHSLMHSNTVNVWRSDLELIDRWVERRPDLFPPDSPWVRYRRALTWSRLANQLLHRRAFAESRHAFMQAMKYGRFDPRTLARGLAACAPATADLYWATKAAYPRMLRGRGGTPQRA